MHVMRENGGASNLRRKKWAISALEEKVAVGRAAKWLEKS